jgi:hypothetical protein
MGNRPILSLADYLNGRSWAAQLRAISGRSLSANDNGNRSSIVEVSVSKRIVGTHLGDPRGGDYVWSVIRYRTDPRQKFSHHQFKVRPPTFM